MLQFRAAASSKCDWSLNLGSLAARGLPDRLQSLNVTLAKQRLRVASDKCDFQVVLSAAQSTARTSVSAAVRSDKCDFSLALLGTSGARSALGRVATRMASDKCDFAVNVQFGPDPNPLIRFTAVASAKCDFSLQSVEIREAGGQWRKVDVAKRGK